MAPYPCPMARVSFGSVSRPGLGRANKLLNLTRGAVGV
jgi:hypothetical protein